MMMMQSNHHHNEISKSRPVAILLKLQMEGHKLFLYTDWAEGQDVAVTKL